MDDRKEKTAPWLSVPQFGDWDQKGVMPDYSMDFSKIRENRKQNKSRASLGNEEELISTVNSKSNTVHSAHSDDLQFHQTHPSTLMQKAKGSFFKPGVSLSETASLPRKGRGKACVHLTLPRPQLWDYTFVVIDWAQVLFPCGVPLING